MDKNIRDELIRHLSQYISRNRIERIREVLRHRTRHVTLVLEDIHKDQNASATLRTCECLGVQDVHVVENSSPFNVDEEVTIGASQWVTLHRYSTAGADNTQKCFADLRARGYRVIATSPDARSRPLEDVSLDRKPAFVFGNEEAGLSEYALEAADGCVRLPMYGFTQSYNISVSVAVTLTYVLERLRRSEIDWMLSDEEKKELTLVWYREVVRRSDLIEKKFLEDLEHQG